MICPGCERTCRIGTLVTLIDPVERTAERRRVCKRCATGGLIVVAPRQTPIVKGIKIKPASGDVRVEQAIRTLTTYAKAARISAGREQALEREFQLGRAEALEGAVKLLRGPR